MIAIATSLFFEPFVRILFQLGVYQYSLDFFGVLKAIVRFGLLDGLLMLVVFPITVSIDGYKKEKS